MAMKVMVILREAPCRLHFSPPAAATRGVGKQTTFLKINFDISRALRGIQDESEWISQSERAIYNMKAKLLHHALFQFNQSEMKEQLKKTKDIFHSLNNS